MVFTMPKPLYRAIFRFWWDSMAKFKRANQHRLNFPRPSHDYDEVDEVAILSHYFNNIVSNFLQRILSINKLPESELVSTLL